MKSYIVIAIIILVTGGFLFYQGLNQFPIPKGDSTEVVTSEQPTKDEGSIDDTSNNTLPDDQPTQENTMDQTS